MAAGGLWRRRGLVRTRPVLCCPRAGLTLGGKARETFKTAYRLFIQLNGYLLAAVLIAGAIKVLVPTSLIVNWVGGKALNSVLVASVVALLAYG